MAVRHGLLHLDKSKAQDFDTWFALDGYTSDRGSSQDALLLLQAMVEAAVLILPFSSFVMLSELLT